VTAPFAPPWPVGLGLGTDGANVIESYVPLDDLGSPSVLRLSAVASGVSGEDSVVADDLLVIDVASDVPTLSTWALMALSLAIAVIAVVLTGRRGGATTTLVLLLGFFFTAGIVWAAITLDGLPADWSAGDLMATDPIDGPGTDLRAVFARSEDGVLYFRFDAFDHGCDPADPPYGGNFVVVQDAWADYNAGDLVPIEQDLAPFSFRIRSTNNPFISNPGTSFMSVTVDPVTALATVASNECFDYGPGFCLNVTGSGTASCEGEIDLVLAFGGFTGQRFVLTPEP
jgi:hypothetical protein